MLRKIRGSRGGKILAGFLLLITTIAVSVSCSIRQPENSGQLVDRKDMPDVMKELAQNELTGMDGWNVGGTFQLREAG